MLRILKKIMQPDREGPDNKHAEEPNQADETGFSARKFLDPLFDENDPVEAFAGKVLSALAREMEILQAVFLVTMQEGPVQKLKYLTGYAYIDNGNHGDGFCIGDGLPGQVARDGRRLCLKEVPGGYMTVRTGLGEATPGSLVILPVRNMNEVLGVIEIASFKPFTREEEYLLEDVSERLGEYLKHYDIKGFINHDLAV